MSITKETRRESYNTILDNVGERQLQCLNGLSELGGSATANELSMHLFESEITPYFNRNFVHPRLNELVALKLVSVIGKRKCHMTNRNIAIYKLN